MNDGSDFSQIEIPNFLSMDHKHIVKEEENQYNALKN